MFKSIWGIRRACIRKVGTIAHLEVYDLDTCLPGRCEDSLGGSYGALDHGYVNPGPVKHTSLRAKVILHVDDKHNRLGDVDAKRLRLRLDYCGTTACGSGVRLSGHALALLRRSSRISPVDPKHLPCRTPVAPYLVPKQEDEIGDTVAL